MFLQGPATHSWPAACSRSSAPRRRPGSRRAPCSPSATSGPQRGGSRRQLKNNKFSLLWGEAPLCLPYVCFNVQSSNKYKKK